MPEYGMEPTLKAVETLSLYPEGIAFYSTKDVQAYSEGFTLKAREQHTIFVDIPADLFEGVVSKDNLRNLLQLVPLPKFIGLRSKLGQAGVNFPEQPIQEVIIVEDEEGNTIYRVPLVIENVHRRTDLVFTEGKFEVGKFIIPGRPQRGVDLYHMACQIAADPETGHKDIKLAGRSVSGEMELYTLAELDDMDEKELEVLNLLHVALRKKKIAHPKQHSIDVLKLLRFGHDEVARGTTDSMLGIIFSRLSQNSRKRHDKFYITAGPHIVLPDGIMGRVRESQGHMPALFLYPGKGIIRGEQIGNPTDSICSEWLLVDLIHCISVESKSKTGEREAA